jgi:hypothetical protein
MKHQVWINQERKNKNRLKLETKKIKKIKKIYKSRSFKSSPPISRTADQNFERNGKINNNITTNQSPEEKEKEKDPSLLRAEKAS